MTSNDNKPGSHLVNSHPICIKIKSSLSYIIWEFVLNFSSNRCNWYRLDRDGWRHRRRHVIPHIWALGQYSRLYSSINGSIWYIIWLNMFSNTMPFPRLNTEHVSLVVLKILSGLFVTFWSHNILPETQFPWPVLFSCATVSRWSNALFLWHSLLYRHLIRGSKSSTSSANSRTTAIQRWHTTPSLPWELSEPVCF